MITASGLSAGLGALAIGGAQNLPGVGSGGAALRVPSLRPHVASGLANHLGQLWSTSDRFVVVVLVSMIQTIPWSYAVVVVFSFVAETALRSPTVVIVLVSCDRGYTVRFCHRSCSLSRITETISLVSALVAALL